MQMIQSGTKIFTAAAAALSMLALAACGGDGDGGGGEAAVSEDRVLGDADAPVTVIEYASVTCGACGAFHERTYGDFKEKYIDTGLVKFIFREFPTAPQPVSMAGFLLARCAPEDEYYDVIDTLFERQRQILTSQDPRAELVAVANAVGISEQEFDACIADDSEIQRINEVVQTGLEEYNVSATPTFVIDGESYTGARPLSFFDEKLAPLLGDQAPAPEPEAEGEDAAAESGQG